MQTDKRCAVQSPNTDQQLPQMYGEIIGQENIEISV